MTSSEQVPDSGSIYDNPEFIEPADGADLTVDEAVAREQLSESLNAVYTALSMRLEYDRTKENKDGIEYWHSWCELCAHRLYPDWGGNRHATQEEFTCCYCGQLTYGNITGTSSVYMLNCDGECSSGDKNVKDK